jgi:hypothetical protein
MPLDVLEGCGYPALGVSISGSSSVSGESPPRGSVYIHSIGESKGDRRRRILLEELAFLIVVVFVLVILPGWWCIGRRHCYGDSWRANVNYWKWEEPAFRELLSRSRAEAEPLLSASPESSVAKEAVSDLLYPAGGSVLGAGEDHASAKAESICTLTANRAKGFEYVRFTWPLLLKRWGMKHRICRNPSIRAAFTAPRPEMALNTTSDADYFLPCDRFFIQRTVVRQKPAAAPRQRPNRTTPPRPASQRSRPGRQLIPARRLASVDLGGIDEEQDEEDNSGTPETPLANASGNHSLNHTSKPTTLDPEVPNEAFEEIRRFMASAGFDNSSLLVYDPWIDLAGNLSRKKPCPNAAAAWEHRLILSAARAIQHCAQFPNLSTIVILEDDALPTRGVGRKLHAAFRLVKRTRRESGRNPPGPPKWSSNVRSGRSVKTGSRELPTRAFGIDARDQDWFMLRAFVTTFFTMEWDPADGISNFLRFQAPFWIGLGLALMYALHARIPFLHHCFRAATSFLSKTTPRVRPFSPKGTRKWAAASILVWLFHGGRFVSINELSRVFLVCSAATMFFMWVLGKQNLNMWWSILQVFLFGDQEGVLVKWYDPHAMSQANVFNPTHALAYANYLLVASTTTCYPIDHLQNLFSKDRGLNQYHVVPDLFQHVGFITSASGTKKRSGVWTEHLTSLTWGEG